MIRLGVVSYLNSRPLIDGLVGRADVACTFDVPAALPGRLARGEVDVALVPIVDVLRAPDQFEVVSNACIAAHGETMTVRVFSQVPPDRITTLWADVESHTSVMLAQVLWREVYRRALTVEPMNIAEPPSSPQAILLIGDKVVDPRRGSYAYEVDLGGAWSQHSSLPFVFAVWACRRGAGLDHEAAAELLAATRDRGVARAAEIAAEAGPAHGWSVATAERYLTRCLRFTLDGAAQRGAEGFAASCVKAGLLTGPARIRWPKRIRAGAAGAAG